MEVKSEINRERTEYPVKWVTLTCPPSSKPKKFSVAALNVFLLIFLYLMASPGISNYFQLLASQILW